MARKFDPDRVAELGWRQGAILDRRLALLAWDHAPKSRMHPPGSSATIRRTRPNRSH